MKWAVIRKGRLYEMGSYTQRGLRGVYKKGGYMKWAVKRNGVGVGGGVYTIKGQLYEEGGYTKAWIGWIYRKGSYTKGWWRLYKKGNYTKRAVT